MLTLTITQLSTYPYVASPGVTVPGVMANIAWNLTGAGTITIKKAVGSGAFSTWASVSSALGTYHKTTLEDLEGTTQRFYAELVLSADPGTTITSAVYTVTFGTRQPTLTYTLADLETTFAALTNLPALTLGGMSQLIMTALTDDSAVPDDAELITIGVTVAQNALPSGGQDRCASLFLSDDADATRWHCRQGSGFLPIPDATKTFTSGWWEFAEFVTTNGGLTPPTPNGTCGAISIDPRPRNPAVANCFEDRDNGGYYDRTKLFDGTYRWGINFAVPNSHPTLPASFKAAQITQFDLLISYFTAISVSAPKEGTAIFGKNTKVTSSLTVAMGLDGVTRQVDGAEGSQQVFGRIEIDNKLGESSAALLAQRVGQGSITLNPGANAQTSGYNEIGLGLGADRANPQIARDTHPSYLWGGSQYKATGLELIVDETPGAQAAYNKGRGFAIDENAVLDVYEYGGLGTGAKPGCGISVGQNTSGSKAAAFVQLQGRNNTYYYLWVDAAGKLRIHTSPPTEDNTTVADTAGTVVGAQS